MEFKIIFQTSRKITIELLNYGIWYAEKPYQVVIDGSPVLVSESVVQTVEGFFPDRDYEIYLVNEDGKSETICFHTDYEFVTLDVKRFGAKGDGVQDDTLFIQAAINACPKAGRVWISKGNYKVTSLFLKSDLILDIDEGAVISGNTNREDFPILPGMISSYDETSEYNLGTWEGNPLDMFSSLITGINISNVVITGKGTLDGNASYENWWQEEGRTKIGGAWRPRMIYLNHCENVTVQGLTIQNSPSWNLHPYFSNHTQWIDLRILNPRISPNTDGMDPESVDGLLAVGIYFSLGDDCVAVKSGKYYMGHKYKVPSQNLEFRQCYMRHGHGALTLGSEMASGIRNLVCHNCIFEDTDRGLRIKTRRGRGEDAVIDQIVFENILMDGVYTPIVVNSYYWCCDPDGHSQYVESKEPLPVDERTPVIKTMEFHNIEAKNCHVAASYVYGLPEAKIEKLVLDNISVNFADYPIPEYPDLLAGVEPCTRMGMFLNNIKELHMNQVTVNGQEGADFLLENIDTLINGK
jgi:polygalacturonase